jgi:radical SAM protein with 4Fe4S-binding SPASM domain
LTINADGSIGSCPNSAVDNTFGHINDDIIDLLTAPNRINSIVCESQRNPICYECEVYDICNGDCHQLAWEDDVCAAPKKFMQMLKRDNNIELYREVLSSFVGQE